jgi:flagellar motility protein MotE (MotC chaperone)
MTPPEAVAAVAFFGVVGIVLRPLIGAISRRIGGAADAPAGELRALRDEIERQREELDSVHERLAQVDELQNRVDFAERMLAQVKDKTALPGGR